MGADRHPSFPFPAVLRRLLQLWWLHARMDLIWTLRGWKSFLMYAVSDVILNISAIASTLLLAARFHGIGRWSEPQILFMLAYSLLAGGLMDLLFAFNLAFISRRIGRGQLDHLIIQPQPLWMTLVTEGFLPFSGSGTALAGAGFLAWSIHHAQIGVTPGWVLLLLVNLAASAAVLWSFSYFWGSLAFWAPRGAEEINSSTMHLMNQLRPFPLDGLGGAALAGMLTVAPAGFVAWYPCRALLGLDARPWAPAVTPAAAVVFLAAALLLFRFGLRHYARTGSQRYLSFGHRR